MSLKHHQISITSLNNPKNKFSYQLKSSEQLTLNDLLISKFDDYNFQEHEIKNLSRDLRFVLKSFELLKENDLEKCSQALVNFFNSQGTSHLEVKAGQMSSYVVLNTLSNHASQIDPEITCYFYDAPALFLMNRFIHQDFDKRFSIKWDKNTAHNFLTIKPSSNFKSKKVA